jgi:hypothetical protein
MQATAVMQQMNDYLGYLGVTAETVPAVESSYEALLGILDEHFSRHPYVLGGRPSIADFGLMAPLFAHLSRDPHPSHLMKLRAPNVYRWTERMNLAQIRDDEFWDQEETYPAGDELPPTLVPLLEHIFSDWGPELAAYVRRFNEWIATEPSLPPGHLVSGSGERRVHPSLGEVTYELRGRTFRRQCAVQAVWHFEQEAARARALKGAAADRWRDLLEATGGTAMMGLHPARGMRRSRSVLCLE